MLGNHIALYLQNDEACIQLEMSDLTMWLCVEASLVVDSSSKQLKNANLWITSSFCILGNFVQFYFLKHLNMTIWRSYIFSDMRKSKCILYTKHIFKEYTCSHLQINVKNVWIFGKNNKYTSPEKCWFWRFGILNGDHRCMTLSKLLVE